MSSLKAAVLIFLLLRRNTVSSERMVDLERLSSQRTEMLSVSLCCKIPCLANDLACESG